jgi:hypothetical protein
MKGVVGTVEIIVPGLKLLLELMTQLYRSEGCCGIFWQNYTGVKDTVGIFARIILD